MIDIIILQPDLDWQIWVQPLMSGCVMAGILVMLYLWQENRRRVGYARGTGKLQVRVRPLRNRQVSGTYQPAVWQMLVANHHSEEFCSGDSLYRPSHHTRHWEL